MKIPIKRQKNLKSKLLYKRILRNRFFLIFNPYSANRNIMLQQLPKELAHARELMDQAKLDEAFEIVENFEKVGSLSPEDQLSALLIKGKIFRYKLTPSKALHIFEGAYQLSQKLGLEVESVEALIGLANSKGDPDEASVYVKDAEMGLKALAGDPSTGMLKTDLLKIKSSYQLIAVNLNRAAETAQECLKLIKEEQLGNNLDLTIVYHNLGFINAHQGNHTKALEYAIKSLELNKELNYAVLIAGNYSLMAFIYLAEGDYDQALRYCKQSLSINEIISRTRLDDLIILARIYSLKSELNRALKYGLQAVALGEKLNQIDLLITSLNDLGSIYRIMGKKRLAIESFERALMLSEKWGLIFQMARSLSLLISTYIEEGSPAKANRYFSRLTVLYNQTEEKGKIDISSWYLSSKAYIMKTSTRIRDRADAQTLYKELINQASGNFLISCISNLCDLLLEELSLYNDSEILNEITPLISKALEMAETSRNYFWLAETKLLQAKLALIQMKFEEAKKLFVEAQRIAGLHGLNLLASKISSEHDNLLKQVEIWDKIEKEDAPMAERIKLASTDGVLERIEGRRALEPPESVEEEPILILIMDSSGVTYFNHSFIHNWDYSDLFSSFMSAFNTFIDEIFSKSIDRIRIGENTILINPVDQFLTCYVIKGQSYLALQKLSRFNEAIRENSVIWQALEKSVKTSEMLELDNPPALKTVIDEIFAQ
jgi:tetratricopeptide (TPR) repeat protein